MLVRIDDYKPIYGYVFIILCLLISCVEEKQPKQMSQCAWPTAVQRLQHCWALSQ